MEIQTIFTARQVLSITQVKPSQLSSWLRSGIIRPSVSMAEGSGSRRLYSREDLFVIRAAAALRNCGLTGRALRKALEYVQQNFEGFASTARVGRDVNVRAGGESVSVLKKPGQMALDFTPQVTRAVAEIAVPARHAYSRVI